MIELFAICPVCTLYKAPDIRSERVDETLFGMPVYVENDTGDFYLIKTHYNYSGYVRKIDVGYNEQGVKQMVSWRFSDVYILPNMKTPLVTTLTRGAVVDTFGTVDNWTKIALPGGYGYIRTAHLSEYITTPLTDEDALRKNIISCAEAYLGTQYRWGGKSTYGIDCSGLCSVAYMQNGIIIYRDASIQDGFPIRKIPYSALKPADLLYSKGHIMMYLGNGKMIHSSNSRTGVAYDDAYTEDKTIYCGTFFKKN